MIGEWWNKIFEASGLDSDRRFKKWVKKVDAVNPSGKDGYAFEGAFVKEGTIDLEIKPRLFLVASTTGSQKYQTTNYRVVRMDTDGNLHLEDIKTDDSTPGWALRIRDPLFNLLRDTIAEEVMQEIDISEKIVEIVKDMLENSIPGDASSIDPYLEQLKAVLVHDKVS